MKKHIALFCFDICVFFMTLVLYSEYHHGACTLIMGPVYLLRVMLPRYIAFYKFKEYIVVASFRDFMSIGFDIGVFCLTLVLYFESGYAHEFCTLLMGPIYLLRVMIPRFITFWKFLDFILQKLLESDE